MDLRKRERGNARGGDYTWRRVRGTGQNNGRRMPRHEDREERAWQGRGVSVGPRTLSRVTSVPRQAATRFFVIPSTT